MDFRNRHVIVTGGTGALGSALVDALIGAGATCHVPDRSGSEVAQGQRRPQVVVYPGIDLGDEAAVERLFAAVPGLWASIHVAGGFAGGPITGISQDDFSRQIDTNLTTCFLCCRSAVKAMLQAGSGGRIVNVAARQALEWRLGSGATAYAVSKAGVAALTVALAEEVAKHDILVNAVAPSIMDTPANRKAMPKANHAGWPKVEEVANTILFLASTDNKVTRGAVVPVYGRS
jgi:NAD(P)-dependent dehydrogenase (short-subunit alcohol dehydrogenase family)